MRSCKILGILNVTPDSFFDGGKYIDLEGALAHAERLVREGADIIEIGGESNRPGSCPISLEEERERVVPVLKALQVLSHPLAIDTSKPAIAEEALQLGIQLLNNSIFSFEDDRMVRLAVEYNIDICVMHMQNSPFIMQKKPQYPDGVVPHVLEWFKQKCDFLISSGVDPSKIIIDPGIGFGKTTEHNIEILASLQTFKKLGFRVLLGSSRKSFLKNILKKPVSKLLPATLTINTMSILGGADMIRVHDVEAHSDVIEVLQYIKNQNLMSTYTNYDSRIVL